MLKKIYKLLIDIKNNFWVKLLYYKYLYSDYMLYFTKLVINLITKEIIIVTVILIWIILFVIGNITIDRLVRLSIILIIICMYKILHKKIYNIYFFLIKYINITDSFLLKIYKFENPLILILIEIELVLFRLIRYIQVKNFQLTYINFIYHLLYNISGLNGIKIILAEMYKNLLDWKNLGIYELLFKRIYGIVLSIIVFINIENYYIWVYILLIIMPYIYIILGYDIYSIKEVEEGRWYSHWIGNLLEIKNKNFELNFDDSIIIKIEPQLINKNVKKCLGFIRVNEILIYELTYDNFLILLILSTSNTMQWWYSYLYIILQRDSNINHYIYIKNTILKKAVKTENDIKLLDYCDYQILLTQLCLYYIWDIEKELSISKTLLYIDNTGFGFDYTDYTYSYNFDAFKTIYNEQIRTQLNKFFDLYHKDNYNFYKEMYNYLYDIEFKKTLVYENLKIDDIHKIYEYYNGDNIKIKELSMQLENFKNDWEINQNNSIELKYYNLFSRIQNIKKKMTNN